MYIIDGILKTILRASPNFLVFTLQKYQLEIQFATRKHLQTHIIIKY